MTGFIEVLGLGIGVGLGGIFVIILKHVENIMEARRIARALRGRRHGR